MWDSEAQTGTGSLCTPPCRYMPSGYLNTGCCPVFLSYYRRLRPQPWSGLTAASYEAGRHGPCRNLGGCRRGMLSPTPPLLLLPDMPGRIPSPGSTFTCWKPGVLDTHTAEMTHTYRLSNESASASIPDYLYQAAQKGLNSSDSSNGPAGLFISHDNQ